MILHATFEPDLELSAVMEDDPQMDADTRDKLLKGWKKAVKCSYGWAKED